MSSELENSGIRVAVGDCSVTERRRWRPLYQTGKTVHVHAKHYKHNEDGRTAPCVCGNGSVLLSHSGNVVTRIGIHTHILTLKVPKRKPDVTTNSVDPDEVAQHEPPHLDLQCLSSCLSIHSMIYPVAKLKHFTNFANLHIFLLSAPFPNNKVYNNFMGFCEQ